jgi:hypothetical protein
MNYRMEETGIGSHHLGESIFASLQFQAVRHDIHENRARHPLQ